MARQTYYVTREQKHPLYRTRMLQAGPLDLDASAARLYRRMGVELNDQAPRKAAPKVEAPAEAPAVEAREPVAKKAAPKVKAKRATRRQK